MGNSAHETRGSEVSAIDPAKPAMDLPPERVGNLREISPAIREVIERLFEDGEAPGELEDCLQETLARLCDAKTWTEYRAEKGSCGAFAYGVRKRVCREACRQGLRWPKALGEGFDVAGAEPEPWETAWRRERAERVRAAIRQLRPADVAALNRWMKRRAEHNEPPLRERERSRVSRLKAVLRVLLASIDF